MCTEQSTVDNLTAGFRELEGKCFVTRDRRITAGVPQDTFMKVMEYACKELSFTMLMTITGLDLGDRLQAIYHLARQDGTVLNLKFETPKSAPVIDTVTPIYQGAVFYERELADLLGFEIRGIPQGSRYPLPDLWPPGQYPLRKDWRPDAPSVETGSYTAETKPAETGTDALLTAKGGGSEG